MHLIIRTWIYQCRTDNLKGDGMIFKKAELWIFERSNPVAKLKKYIKIALLI